MVDTLVLGASAFGHGGSSPLIRTNENDQLRDWSFSLVCIRMLGPRTRKVEVRGG